MILASSPGASSSASPAPLLKSGSVSSLASSGHVPEEACPLDMVLLGDGAPDDAAPWSDELSGMDTPPSAAAATFMASSSAAAVTPTPDSASPATTTAPSSASSATPMAPSSASPKTPFKSPIGSRGIKKKIEKIKEKRKVATCGASQRKHWGDEFKSGVLKEMELRKAQKDTELYAKAAFTHNVPIGTLGGWVRDAKKIHASAAKTMEAKRLSVKARKLAAACYSHKGDGYARLRCWTTEDRRITELRNHCMENIKIRQLKRKAFPIFLIFLYSLYSKN